MQVHYFGFCGPPCSGCEQLFAWCKNPDDSPSYLQHYINRRVGVKLPQHSLLLHCFAAKNLTIAEAWLLHSNEAPLWILLRQKKGFGKKVINFQKLQEIYNQMARVRSTARVERDGDETEATETIPISEAMRRSGLVSSHLLPKQHKLMLKKLVPKMSTAAGCQVNLVIWTLEGPPSLKVIFLRWWS